MRRELILTSTELRNLMAYAETQSRFRTYRLVRDTGNRLYVWEPNGRLWHVEASAEAATE